MEVRLLVTLLHGSDLDPGGRVGELLELGVLPVPLRDVLVRVEEVLPHPLLRVEGLAAHRAVGDGAVVVHAVHVLLQVALGHEGLAAQRAVEEPALYFWQCLLSSFALGVLFSLGLLLALLL